MTEKSTEEAKEPEYNWYNQKGEVIASFPAEVQGIVYLMTCKISGKKYIGKKNVWATKTYQLKGKKKKKKVESDWKTYFGSSPDFLKHIEEVGKENIYREVLHECATKAEMTYLETHEQFKRHVLIDANYFNGWIMCRVTKPHLKKISEEVARKVGLSVPVEPV